MAGQAAPNLDLSIRIKAPLGKAATNPIPAARSSDTRKAEVRAG
jgi:hypothetical protein